MEVQGQGIGALGRVTLCIGGGTFGHVSVVDIALDRIEVAYDAPDCVGRPVVVTLERLTSRDGIVRWQRGKCLGIEFDRPLSLDDFAFWLRRGA